MKDEKYTIISIAAEKAFDKILLPFMIKILNKKGIEGKYLHITKAICEKITLTSYPIFKESYPSNIRNKTKTPGQDKETIGIQIGKEGVRLSQFTEDEIPYVENPKNSIQKQRKKTTL